jgi:predicted DNA-binding WGR domain protein
MSIMQTRYFELSNPTTGEHKFYELTLHDNGTLLSRYGRIGAHGQSKTQHFASLEAMLSAFEKTTAEKLNKGYQPATLGQTAAQETQHQRILRSARTLYSLISNGNPVLAQQCSAEFKAFIEDEDNKEEYEGQNDELIATGFKEAADWELVFFVDWKDTESMLDALDTLCANLEIDIDFNWACEHPEDDLDVGQIMLLAHAQLQEIDYGLWHWDTGDDAYLGWIARDDDYDGVAQLAQGLGFKAAYPDPQQLA